MVVLVALALPSVAAAQEVPLPPNLPPEPEPPVEIVIPEEPQTITVIVPPLPAPKQQAKPQPEPKADPAPPSSSAAPQPAAASSPSSSAPAPEPAYSPEPAAPEPAAIQPAARKAKAKAGAARASKSTVASAEPARAVATEPALPVVTIVEERRQLTAALPESPYAAADGSSPPFLLALLALAGTLLLGVAGAAPRLALYWPGTFVALTRERDTVTFFGLCLLASGVLAWAIV